VISGVLAHSPPSVITLQIVQLGLEWKYLVPSQFEQEFNPCHACKFGGTP
jgi:hypothetical protein